MAAIIEAVGLKKAFPGEPPLVVVDGLDFTLREGELAAIVGVSGKGKSTLLNLLGGLSSPDAGTICFKGDDLVRLGRKEKDALHRRGIGFIFQTPYLFQALTARENLVFACKACGTTFEDAEIDAVLEQFGLAERSDHLPSELSVGQKRRLMIARAFLADYDVILADEPTNDLDEQWSSFVFGKLKEFAHEAGKGVVVVTHDLAMAKRADSVYALEHGKLSEWREATDGRMPD